MDLAQVGVTLDGLMYIPSLTLFLYFESVNWFLFIFVPFYLQLTHYVMCLSGW
jgi:hypothetical protein